MRECKASTVKNAESVSGEASKKTNAIIFNHISTAMGKIVLVITMMAAFFNINLHGEEIRFFDAQIKEIFQLA